MSEIPEKLLPFCDYCAKALSTSTRLWLSKHLNPEQDSLSASLSLVMDWRGVAEFVGFSPLDIDNFMREKNPTTELLKQWVFRDGATIGTLLNALEAIERFDILNDDQLVSNLERDCIAYQKTIELQRTEVPTEETQPIQVDEVTSQDESRFITVNEASSGVPEYFDAFVCYTSEDFDFVRQMMHRLETVHGLKLCIVSRDLMPGCAKYVIMAKLIQERCRKMIIVLSPDYIKSKECEFQTRFAHSLAPGAKEKKLIPVIYRHCAIPPILNHICTVDYTRCDMVEWFWIRLANSLKSVPKGDTLVPDKPPWPTGTTAFGSPCKASSASGGGPSEFIISSDTSATVLQPSGNRGQSTICPRVSAVMAASAADASAGLGRSSSNNSLTETGSWTDLSSGITMRMEDQTTGVTFELTQNPALEPETENTSGAKKIKGPLQMFFKKLRR